jgi:hypothetical protein
MLTCSTQFIFQQSSIIVQANVSQALIPSATALTSLFQLFGGLIGSSICSAIFQGQLIQNLKRYAPSVDAHLLQTQVRGVYFPLETNMQACADLSR